MPPQPDYPEGGGEQALQVSAAHLQVALQSIGAYDGKMMFLMALQIAAISAQVGLSASADPKLELLIAGIATSALAFLLGVWGLWTSETDHFPSPTTAMALTRRARADANRLAWIYVVAMRRAALRARLIIVRKGRITRLMLILTPIAVGLLMWTALTLPTATERPSAPAEAQNDPDQARAPS